MIMKNIRILLARTYVFVTVYLLLSLFFTELDFFSIYERFEPLLVFLVWTSIVYLIVQPGIDDANGDSNDNET